LHRFTAQNPDLQHRPIETTVVRAHARAAEALLADTGDDANDLWRCSAV
jgi:hypothetical protein